MIWAIRFWFALMLIALAILALSGCVYCPDHECPSFPNAAPRQ